MTAADALFANIRNSYDSDMFLGFTCTYYVPSNLRVDIDEWMARVGRSGLKRLTPKKPRAIDAFKRATATAAENRRMRDGEYQYKFLVRDAGSDQDKSFRTIVVEQLDSEGHKLSYGEAVLFTYDRKTEVIEPEPIIDYDFLAGFPEDLIRLISDKIERVYTQYYTEVRTLNDIKVRELIKGVLVDQTLGVPVRPVGQPYFVLNFRNPDSAYHGNHDKLVALDKFINGVGETECPDCQGKGIVGNGGGTTECDTCKGDGNVVDRGISGCSFHWAPLVDDAMQRQFVRQSFLDETSDSVGVFMDQMAKMIKGDRPLTESSVDSMLQEYATLSTKVDEYKTFLEDELLVAQAELKLMFKQCSEMQKAYDRKGKS